MDNAPVKADASAQLQLLDVQAIDARIDQARHQRASLPEMAEIAALEATRQEVDGQRRDQQIVVDDLQPPSPRPTRTSSRSRPVAPATATASTRG